MAVTGLGVGVLEARFSVCITSRKGSSQKPPTDPQPGSLCLKQRIEQDTDKAVVKGVGLIKARSALHRVGADSSKPAGLELPFLGLETLNHRREESSAKG